MLRTIAVHHHQHMGNVYVDYSTQQWPSRARSEHSYHFSNDRDMAMIDHLLQQD